MLAASAGLAGEELPGSGRVPASRGASDGAEPGDAAAAGRGAAAPPPVEPNRRAGAGVAPKNKSERKC